MDNRRMTAGPKPGRPSASREDYERLIGIAADWVWETDTEHRFTYISSGIEDVLGRPAKDLIGRSRRDGGRSIQNDPKRFDEQFAALERGETIRDFAYQIADSEREIHWIAVSGHPIHDEDGKCIGYRGFGRDLRPVLDTLEDTGRIKTEQKRMMGIINASMDTVSAGVVIYDKDHRIVYANNSIREMFPEMADLYQVGTTVEDVVRGLFDKRVFKMSEARAGLSDAEIEGRIQERIAEYHQEHYSDDRELSDGRWCRIENRRLPSGIIVNVRSDITELKKQSAELEEAKAEIEKSFEMVQTILDNIPMGVIVYDQDEKFLLSNKANHRMQSGMAPVMVPGKTMEQAIEHAHTERLWAVSADAEMDELHDSDPDEWKRRKLQEFRTAEFEAIRRPAPGKWIKAVNRKLESGFFIGLRIDVSDFKEQENALAEKLRENELFESIIEAIPAAVYAKTPDLKLVYANSGWEKIAGIPKEQAVGKTDADVYGDIGLSFMESDRSVLASGKVIETEEVVGMDDGHKDYRLARKSMAVSSDGSTYIVGVTTDITELKTREQEAIAARMQAELAQNVLNQLSHPVIVKDSNLRYLVVNQAFADILGKSIDDIVGLNAAEIFGRDVPEVSQDDREVLEGGLTRMNEHEIRRADGTTFMARATKTGKKMPDGSKFLLVVVEDVSDYKEREAALRAAQEKAEAADRAKSEFLANMSHEIRTPMNGVLGMAELLAATDLDSKQKTFADVIMKSGNALLTIINDILDFSKIDAGQMELEPEPFHLRDAVSDVATLMTARAQQKDLEMIVRVDPALNDSYVGDVGRLRQVVTNLVSNAVKFTDEGHVLIDVDGRDAGDSTELHFKVTDTGCGIPQEKLDQVFEKFSQVDTSSTRRHEGTGLGLAICSAIIRLMDGEYGVESEEGKGSTFWFRIALPKHGEKRSLRPAQSDVRGSRILIIDDNSVNRAILMEQMSAWQMDSYAVGSGLEGLQILREAHRLEQPMDCVILDYQMPGMNGADVAAAIRSDKRIAQIPIVMLTSVDKGISNDQMRRLRIEKHLMKPARSSLLLEAITETISGARQSEFFGNTLRAEPQESEVAEEWPSTSPIVTESGTPFRIDAAPVPHDEPKGSAAVEFSKHVTEAPRASAPAEAHGATDEAPAGVEDMQRPAAPPTPSATAGSGPSSSPESFALDILIAEDNEVNQLVFSQILLESGYAFEIVGDGRQAVETSGRKPPRMILMDVSMPEMNGYEATEAIRSREARTGYRTPIVGVTAHALKGDREKCIEAGMDDYLPKPISPDTLLRKVRDWMGQDSNTVAVK